MRVRVRGIYATAITKLLLDNGLEVAHASEKIRERFGIEESGEPPTVTVKDTEQRHGVVVVGEYEHGKKVFEILREELSPVCWVSKLPLHSIVKGRVVAAKDGSSIVEMGDYVGVIDRELEVGSEVLVDVARPFLPNDDAAKLSTNYTVYGKYVALIHGLGRRTIFSRHITSRKLRDELAALSAMSDVGEWCIKWRSSATLAKLEDLLKDVRETHKKAIEILKRGEGCKPGEIVYSGEFFAILCFDRRAKTRLDEIRGEVLPTIENHHSLKSMGESEIVDFCEHLLARGIETGGAAMDYILARMREQKSVAIEHVSVLSGNVVKLTPGKPVGDFCLKRVFRRGGIFDGLNVKKEPGDYDLMEFSTELPLILHKYYGRDGSFKGIYVNVNTPPEVSRCSIRYIDMEVDVVASQQVEIIDAEKLERAYELGIISAEVRNYYMRVAERVRRILEDCEDLAEISLKDLAGGLKSEACKR